MKCLVMGLLLLSLMVIQIQMSWSEDFVSNEPQREALISADQMTILPGMILNINVYHEPDFSGSYQVNPFGKISYPLIGEINVLEKDIEEVKQSLKNELSTYMIDPQISVTLDQGNVIMAQMNTVAVLGEIRTPGAYVWRPKMTLTEVLAQAGGFGQFNPDIKRIRVIRYVGDQKKVIIYDVDSIYRDEKEDPELKPGDEIIVPFRDKDYLAGAEEGSRGAYILGSVRRAGVYEVNEGDTLMLLIAKGGGFTEYASISNIRIVRTNKGRREVLFFNAAAIINGRDDDPEIKPGDMIFVPESFF